MAKKRRATGHITKGNVLDDLGLDEKEAAIAKTKSELLDSIIKIVEKKKYSQNDLQQVLKIPQPRVSELLTGKISKMSIEKLLD